MNHAARFWTGLEKKLCSASSRPNDVGVGDGGGDDGGGADGRGADGGNTGASIGGSTTGVASPARLSPPATAGLIMADFKWGPIHEPHMHGGPLTLFLASRGRVNLCARYFGTHVHPRECPAKQLHCPSYSSFSISYSPLLAIAMHGADVEPIKVCS